MRMSPSSRRSYAGRREERLRRRAQSASVGRLLHDLAAVNDGVLVRYSTRISMSGRQTKRVAPAV